MMHPSSILAISPSFSSYSSHRFAEIAAKVVREINIEEDEEDHRNPNDSVASSRGDDDAGAGHDQDEDFEFTFTCQDPGESLITADELFSDGQIRPIFPIFNRDLILEDDDGKTDDCSTSIRLPLRKLLLMEGREHPLLSTSSSESESLNGIPEGTYCIWTPRSRAPATPDRCKKSNSTGSSKRWRFRDLLHRSSSDGKETFVFLSTAALKKGEKEKGMAEKKTKSSSSSSPAKGKSVSAHEMHYVKNRAMKEGDRHRSYLPYRKEIVGFFANANGLSKGLHHL